MDALCLQVGMGVYGMPHDINAFIHALQGKVAAHLAQAHNAKL
jgi:hypothetical protein